MSRWRLGAACGVAAAAFALYYRTLLPGLDFGDTAWLQAAVDTPVLVPRDAYPLYFATGRLLLKLSSAEPAYLLNLGSAIEGALACGILTLIATELSGSLMAGLASALLFAGSYTFWSQSIIAEVYALHLLLLGGSLLLLLRWSARPTHARLACFFAVYALGFGDHLSMILLLPGFALFLLVSAPEGWRSLFRPTIVMMALGFALAGAAQYLWNLRGLWLGPTPPSGMLDALATAWFDITKSDWRDTLVLRVPRSMLQDRLGMSWFDVTQQFGVVGPVLAVLGLLQLAWNAWRRALLVFALYLVNVIFAFSYNVGDSHVFFLPSHFLLALLMAPGVVLLGDRLARLVSLARIARPRRLAIGLSTALFALFGAMRTYDNFPALDRSADRRAPDLLQALTADLDDRRAIFLADLGWQVENGLAYFGKWTRPDIAYLHVENALLYLPALARDNSAIERRLVLSERARTQVEKSYGSFFSIARDASLGTPTLAQLALDLPKGTPYALCLLKPGREFSVDRVDLIRTLRTLTADEMETLPEADYIAVVGRAGQPGAVLKASMRPFRQRWMVAGVPVEVRMESWLAVDTIRRMGFGHVVAARHHTLTLERGVNLVAFDGSGRSLRSAYAGGLLAPQPRYLCYR
jgi:hypothetical protein